MQPGTNESTIENLFKVKLVASSARNSLSNSNRVVFDVTPDLVENRSVNYKTVDPVHAPGQIFVYGGTLSRTFTISNIKLISRTVEEADLNLRRLWLLRSWTQSHFGKSSTLTSTQINYRDRRSLNELTPEEQSLPLPQQQRLAGSELLGRPPEVLLLSAYSRSSTTRLGGGTQNRIGEHLNRIPVVLQQLTIPYPSDVDFINTSNGVPMPTIMILDMTLAETHSPREYERFSLQDFRSGRLAGF